MLLDHTVDICRPSDYKPHRVTSATLVAEVKSDGRWIRVTTLGYPQLGRRLHGHAHNMVGDFDYLQLPENVVDQWFRKALPREFAIDGELVWPGHPATEVITAITECPSELEYVGFAVAYADGYTTTWPYDRGRELLESLVVRTSEIRARGLTNASYEDMLTLVHAGEEGLVLKGYNYADWWKVKPVFEADCLVVGIKQGNAGKYQDCCGALLLMAGDPLRDVGRCSGMDEATRFAITSSDIGRVCQVEYQSITSRGKFQFPRFVCWRDDKTANDVTKDI